MICMGIYLLVVVCSVCLLESRESGGEREQKRMVEIQRESKEEKSKEVFI